jgi:K+-transporting ATPase c subunit
VIRNQIKPAIIMTIVLTLATGIIYPVVVWAIAQIAFPAQANGSIAMRDGRPVGSTLFGQNFDGDGTSIRGPRRLATRVTMPRIPAARISAPPTRR